MYILIEVGMSLIDMMAVGWTDNPVFAEQWRNEFPDNRIILMCPPIKVA